MKETLENSSKQHACRYKLVTSCTHAMTLLFPKEPINWTWNKMIVWKIVNGVTPREQSLMGEMMLWLVGDGVLLKTVEGDMGGGKETIWMEIKTLCMMDHQTVS